MAKKSPTELNSSVYKPRDDTAFNRFMETQKILGFSKDAGRLGVETFTLIVKAGILEWKEGKLPKKFPGRIVLINRTMLEAGFTNKA